MLYQLYDCRDSLFKISSNRNYPKWGNPQRVEVTVKLQDLPPNSYHNLQQHLQTLPDGSYGVTGYLVPHQDYFTIEPGQTITTSMPFELVRVMHDDMRHFRPQGLSARGRRYLQPNQPTPFEDTIIQPL